MLLEQEAFVRCRPEDEKIVCACFATVSALIEIEHDSNLRLRKLTVILLKGRQVLIVRWSSLSIGKINYHMDLHQNTILRRLGEWCLNVVQSVVQCRWCNAHYDESENYCGQYSGRSLEYRYERVFAPNPKTFVSSVMRVLCWFFLNFSRIMN